MWVRDNHCKCLKTKINSPLIQGPNLGHPSYINKTNSCWLDTALEVAYNIIQRSFQSYSDRFAKIPSDSIAYCLFEVIDHRHLAYGQGGENNSPKWLSSTRDALRSTLEQNGFLKSTKTPENIFVSLYPASYIRTSQYLTMIGMDIRSVTRTQARSLRLSSGILSCICSSFEDMSRSSGYSL